MPCNCGGGQRLVVTSNGTANATVRAQPAPGMPRFKVVGTPGGRDRDGFVTYRDAKVYKAQVGGGTVVPV